MEAILKTTEQYIIEGAKAAFTGLFTSDLWGDLWKCLKELAYLLFVIVVRTLLMLTGPLSMWVLACALKKIDEQREQQRTSFSIRFYEEHNKLVQKVEEV